LKGIEYWKLKIEYLQNSESLLGCIELLVTESFSIFNLQ